MPQKKSRKIQGQEVELTDLLRKSPRLRRQNETGVLSPKTPKHAETRRGRPDSFSTPISKIKKTGLRVLEEGGGKDTDSASKNFRNGLRRSARLERRANFSIPDLREQCANEKRQTRSSVGGCKFVRLSEKSGVRGRNAGKSNEALCPRKEEVVEKSLTMSKANPNSEKDSGGSVVVVSKERKSIVRVHRTSRNAGKTDKKKAGNVSNASRRKSVVSKEVESKGDCKLSKKDTSQKDVEDCGIMKGNGEQHCTRKTQIGEKRKRDGVEEVCDTAQGWSKEQEFSLQRAYYTAKPTPQFWKKVARMVPGKSAEECFDRIHSDHLTPPQPRTRSRAKIKEPSPLSFSASKLLNPAERNTKKLGSKRITLLAQKTVRHILQKQQKEDQDYNADLFAILEPAINPSPLVLEEGTTFASPPSSKTSSSLQRKHLSRLGSSQKAAFTSPPVLKQIKNKALHEKYIDQLHCREAKRKSEALRNSRNSKEPIECKANLLKQNLVKAAKNALVSDAQDAISKFRSLQCRIDDDDGDDCSSLNDDDEEDHGL